ncbi:hypothetical protein [Mesorhizobium sp.]|uniref:hypothetical protein n=1 Tax=Mesorhizobium sp. TaxID=1871066 RepID=UPI0025F0A622|nr:hypothetical protein [Mesorhizobium sp.]
MSLRSTASYRGTVVDHARNREFVYESKLERGFIYISLASSLVEDYLDQPPPVEYSDENGRLAMHTFDAFVDLVDGTRAAVDVKPKSKVVKSGVLQVQRLIEQQHGKSVADVYLVRTEDHIHPDDEADAKLLLRARRLLCEKADAVVAGLAVGLHGWCRLRDLVAASGIGGDAFNAIVRLIGIGGLEVWDDARISYECFVRRARA